LFGKQHTMTEETTTLFGHVFGDETGEAGFKFERGSTPFFVVGLVLTNQPDALREYVQDLRQEFRLDLVDEISFHRSPDRNRVAFLKGLLEFDIEVRALSINKRTLSSELRELSRAEFYAWAFSDLLAHSLGELHSANIVLDEFGTANDTIRAIKRILKQTFSDSIVRQRIRRIGARRSQSEPALQIADIVTGAIYRHVAENDNRFIKIIQSRTKLLTI